MSSVALHNMPRKSVFFVGGVGLVQLEFVGITLLRRWNILSANCLLLHMCWAKIRFSLFDVVDTFVMAVFPGEML